MADIEINPVVRRLQFAGNTGLGPFAFNFNVLEETDLAVYKNETLLDLTSEYTVSLNADGTGSVTLTGSGDGTAVVPADYVTIIGGRLLERTTDFTTGGSLSAAALNNQLDSQVIMTQQMSERITRSLHTHPGDPDTDMEIPLVDDRASKLLGFDANGAPAVYNLLGLPDTAEFVSVQFTGGAGDQGTVSWNTDEETLDLIQNGAVLQLGQEVQYHCRNNTGSTIPNGTAVMATGTIGASGRITIAPMVADGSIAPRFFLGIATEDISAGDDGKVTHFGKVRGINTSGFAEGAVLWLDPAVGGGLTATEPTPPNLRIATAFVVSSKNNGTLFVRANQGHAIADSHDVEVDTPQTGDVLTYNSGRWQNHRFTTARLTDVDTTGKTNGSVLVYNSSTEKFTATTTLENQIIQGGTF